MTTSRALRDAWTSPAAALLQLTILVAGFVWLAAHGAAGMNYNWQWYQVPRYLLREVNGELFLGPLLQGLVVTLEITVWSLLLALAIGLVAALLRLSGAIIPGALTRAYVELIRNTPLLVQLYVFYFVLAPLFGLDRWITGVAALALFEGAYISEIFRAGFLAVPRGQAEAALSLGLSRLWTYVKVILPQAFRIVLPPLASQSIALIKSSAMLSVIAVFELTNEARNIISDTFLTFEIWLTVAAIYWAVTLCLSLLVTLLERRLKTA